jgi:hypothetical protein
MKNTPDENALFPCPFCGENLILNSDHHGQWWEHRNIMSKCPASVTQIHNNEDVKIWNTRVDQFRIDEERLANIIYYEGVPGMTTWASKNIAKAIATDTSWLTKEKV